MLPEYESLSHQIRCIEWFLDDEDDDDNNDAEEETMMRRRRKRKSRTDGWMGTDILRQIYLTLYKESQSMTSPDTTTKSAKWQEAFARCLRIDTK